MFYRGKPLFGNKGFPLYPFPKKLKILFSITRTVKKCGQTDERGCFARESLLRGK